MINLEDILDDAARYLNGQMDAEERSFFEALLDEYPHLKKDLTLFQRVKAGFQWLEDHPPPPKNRMNGSNFRFFWLLLFLAGVLVVGMLIPTGQILPGTNTGPIRPAQTGEQLEAPATQLGGASIEDFSDRGLGVAWTSRGEIAFSGMFMEEIRLWNGAFRSRGGRDMLFGLYHTKQGFQWIRPLGSELPLEAIFHIAVDREDNLIVTGSAGEGTDFGRGPVRMHGTDDIGKRDLFIAKYTPEGKLLWVDHAGGQRIDHLQVGVNRGKKIHVTADNHILTTGVYLGDPVWQGRQLPEGGPNEDIYIAKYAPDGELLWVTTASCDYRITSWGIGSDQFENVYVAGRFGHRNLNGSAYFEDLKLTTYGGDDLFLAKYDPNGRLLWVRQAGSEDQGKWTGEICFDLDADAAGNSIITGCFTGKAKFGETILESYGGRNIFIARYDPEGNLLWANQAGSPYRKERKLEQGNALSYDRNGNIIVTGGFAGQCRFGDIVLDAGEASTDCFIAQYSPEGRLLWVQHLGQFGQLEKASGWGLDINAGNEIVVTGYFSGSLNILGEKFESAGEADLFMLVMDEQGRLLSLRSMMAFND
jgi:hypothetical protein